MADYFRLTTNEAANIIDRAFDQNSPSMTDDIWNIIEDGYVSSSEATVGDALTGDGLGNTIGDYLFGQGDSAVKSAFEDKYNNIPTEMIGQGLVKVASTPLDQIKRAAVQALEEYAFYEDSDGSDTYNEGDEIFYQLPDEEVTEEPEQGGDRVAVNDVFIDTEVSLK